MVVALGVYIFMIMIFERSLSRLLIGAPEAQTAQPGLVKGGAVYRCSTSREDDCEEIPFDTRGKFSHARRLKC